MLSLRDHEIEWIFEWLTTASQDRPCCRRVFELLEHCSVELPLAGPGCIDVPLDAHLDEEAALAEFRLLLDDVQRRLSTCGAVIPLAELQRSAPGRYRGDVRAEVVQHALLKFRSLIDGDLAELA